MSPKPETTFDEPDFEQHVRNVVQDVRDGITDPDGDVSRHTMQRLASLFSAAIGRRLTYAELIA